MASPKNNSSKRSTSWVVYMLKCADDTLYTGITTDIERRLKEHNELKAGAKYTRLRRPVELVFQEPCTDRSDASKREWQIKKLTRPKKIMLINTAFTEI